MKYKKYLIVILAFLAFVVVDIFIDSIFESKKTSEAILDVLKNDCECEDVIQVIYAEGIQFGAEGITTKKAEYQLVNCTYTSIASEAIRVLEILENEIKDFKEFDFLLLEFKNETKKEVIKIKNGIIQT